MQHNPIAVTAEICFKPEAVKAGLLILRNVIDVSRNDEGCITYQLFRFPDTPERFIFIEQWSNFVTWQNHMNTKHLAQVKVDLEPHLAEPLKVHWYDLIY